jgi:hypothetical protein
MVCRQKQDISDYFTSYILFGCGFLLHMCKELALSTLTSP